MKQSTFYYLLRRGVIGGGGSASGFTGLLDTYSGAAAAYSLRQLSSTYSGNAIKVRRASDNAEQDIAFSNNELDTATLETFASGTDAFVTTWYDQSGNGNDAANATASAQPKIVSAGSTILENGKAAIQWDGTNDYLNHTFSTPSQLYRINMSLWIVNNVTGGDTRKVLMHSTPDGTDIYTPYFEYDSNAPSNLRHFSGNAGSFSLTTSSSEFSFNTQRLASVLKNGTTLQEIFMNGSSQGSNTSSNAVVDMNGYNIGAHESATQRWFGGTMQEIVIYNSYESSNRTGIETNINDFYSIY